MSKADSNRRYDATEKGEQRRFRYSVSPAHQAKVCRYQSRLRLAAIKALGSICSRCGFEDPRALQIDEHDKEAAWSVRYRDIINGNPAKSTLLCANCNWIKRAERKEAVGRPRTRPRL